MLGKPQVLAEQAQSGGITNSMDIERTLCLYVIYVKANQIQIEFSFLHINDFWPIPTITILTNY